MGPATTESRAEKEIFDELAALCGSPGYAEAIARFCLRDNLLLFGPDGMNAEVLTKTYTHERLIRTELSTLIGLMIREGLDLSTQSSATIDAYCEKTEALLRELHDSMSGAAFAGLTLETIKDTDFNPFSRAEALREPIFYAAESAYPFQYRDLAVSKYSADDAWLQANRGFTTSNAHRVMHAIQHVQRDRAANFLLEIRARHNPSALSAFSFSLEEVARAARLSADLVKPVLDAFALDPADRNPTFESLPDFNVTNATPIIRTGNGEYCLLQHYSLLEAFYDSPFFWMMADRTYRSTASTHRGAFTEAFATARLARVFSRPRVFQNVTIPGSKGETLGEIDVLVQFGDRIIVVQAKSKRLTLEARKGNDQQLQKDFKGAVQDACDQAMACSDLLLQPDVVLLDDTGSPVPLLTPVRRIYPVCLVSDHYPALAFQARQFLTVPAIDRVASPFVMDVFTLDVLTEMLTSPLRFLSYLELHAAAGDQFLISGELTLLGYHLARNLWVEDGFDMVMLHDDVAASLDAAMIVRREGVPGPRTPAGILTRLEGTSVGRFIHAIDDDPNPAAVGLGMFLLELGEDSVRMTSDAMDRTCAAARRDLRPHNASFPVGAAGITIHANTWADIDAMDRLREYCEMRKYAQKAERWFGLSLDVESGRPRFGLMLDEPWTQDDAMDVLVSGMQKAQPIYRKMPQLHAKKPGRNDPCPCGSGLKYKKCHLR